MFISVLIRTYLIKPNISAVSEVLGCFRVNRCILVSRMNASTSSYFLYKRKIPISAIRKVGLIFNCVKE